MAPTAPAATGAASPAAPAVAKGEGKGNAARSVGLGLPALPGLGLEAKGQPRAGSFCKRLARNVVAMAAVEPSAAPRAASEEFTEFANEQFTEFVNALKQEVRT